MNKETKNEITYQLTLEAASLAEQLTAIKSLLTEIHALMKNLQPAIVSIKQAPRTAGVQRYGSTVIHYPGKIR